MDRMGNLIQWLKSNLGLARTGILVSGGILASVIVIMIPFVVSGGGGAPAGTANLWVDTNGGTCTRQAVPASYNDAAACASATAAWTAATSGDTIRIKNGSYNHQCFVSSKTVDTSVIGESVDGVVFHNDNIECVSEFGGDNTVYVAGSHLVLQDITIDTGSNAGSGVSFRIHDGANNVTFRNVIANGLLPSVLIQAANNFTWTHGNLGTNNISPPEITCTNNGFGSIQMDGPDHATIDHVRINRVKAQSVVTPNVGGCDSDGRPHLERIRFNSASNPTISNVVFEDGSEDGSGEMFSSTTITNLRVINTYFGTLTGNRGPEFLHMDHAVGAHWYYNTFNENGGFLHVDDNTWVGNLGINNPGCDGTHIRNVWQDTGSCGTDTYTSSPLGIGGNGGALSAGSPAIDGGEVPGPTDACTDPTIVNSLDSSDGIRPVGAACDAGVDEFGN